MTPLLPPDPSVQTQLASNSAAAGPLAVVSAIRKPEEDPALARERDILREAQEFFTNVCSYEADWRRRAREEFDFLALKHWPDNLRAERNGRPCLVFDRIGPSIDMVVNDARQSPPEPKISPVGNGADKETAEVLQGLIRNIENDSQADTAYMTAYRHCVSVGRGWWRILSDYETDVLSDDPDNLNADLMRQKLRIGRVPNPFSVYPDPAAQTYDYSDMRRLIATEDLDKDVYDDLFPESRVAGMTTFDSINDRVRQDWFPNGAVRIAEYWKVEETHEDIVLLEGGRVVKASDAYDAKIKARRKVTVRKVRCYKINGAEILEEYEWPGRWIPFIPVLGQEVIQDGKRQLRGMVRAAMDANLQYDYLASKQSEAIGLAPLAPWLIPEGAIEGHEQAYADSNRKAIAVLYYKPTVQGQPVAPPARITAEPNIQAITQALARADNDTKATLSTYDASLGSAGPESSGRAILARQREADNAHFGYHDNLGWSMQHTGRVLLDLFPHYYNAEQVITIVDPDGSVRTIEINKPTMVQGVERVFQLGSRAARYDVTVGSGPSFSSRRDQGVQAMLELTRTMPQAMMRALDLLVRNMDFPGAMEVADRLRPPDIQQQQDDGTPPIPPQFQQKMAQLEQMNQQLMMLARQASDETERLRLSLASQERRTALQEQTKVNLGLAKINSDEAREQLRAEVQKILADLGRLEASPETANPQPAQSAEPQRGNSENAY